MITLTATSGRSNVKVELTTMSTTVPVEALSLEVLPLALLLPLEPVLWVVAWVSSWSAAKGQLAWAVTAAVSSSDRMSDRRRRPEPPHHWRLLALSDGLYLHMHG